MKKGNIGLLGRMPFLVAAEKRETFFERISLFLPELDPRHKEIRRAYDYAKDAFRGTLREGGERYFEHVRAVALILIDYLRIKDHRIIVTALLHDLVEDCPEWTVKRVDREFGEYIAMLVEYLTKPKKGDFISKQDRDHCYHLRFRFAPREFFLIKLSDRLHNILTLASCPRDKQERKIAETRKEYLPYAEEHLILLHELEEAMEEQVKK